MRNESPIFVVGYPRSGTSLLRDILGAHRDIASVPSESDFFVDFNEKYGDLSIQENRDSLLQCFFETEFFRFTNLNKRVIKQLIDTNVDSYQSFFSSIMGEYAKSVAKKTWVEKTPAHGYYLKTITNLFPDARILFIIRDGRDVSISLKNIYFDPSARYSKPIIRTLVTALEWWKYNIEVLSRCISLRSNTWKIVEYERLVYEKDSYVQEIFHFLGVDGQMGKNVRGNWPVEKNTLIKANSFLENLEGISSKPVDRWKVSMIRSELLTFEMICSDMLKAFRYEVENRNCDRLLGLLIMLSTLCISPRQTRRIIKQYKDTIRRYIADREKIRSFNIDPYKL